MVYEPKFDMSLFDTGPVVVLAWEQSYDENVYTLIFSTPNVESISGYTGEEIRDIPEYEWAKLIHPDDLPRVLDNIEQNLEKGVTSFSDQYRVIKKMAMYAGLATTANLTLVKMVTFAGWSVI